MVVVVHEHVGMQNRAKAGWKCLQDLQEVLSIPIVPKDGPTFISPRRHVIHPNRQLNPQWPYHAQTLFSPFSIVK